MRRVSRFPAGERKCHRAACAVTKRFRTGVRYCCMSCASKDGMMRVSPVAARERALKAGKAAGEAHTRRALAAIEGLTPREAYLRGYRNGYDKGHNAGFYKGRRSMARQGAAA